MEDSYEADFRGKTMGFEEACELAQAIRRRSLWHVVVIEVSSGTKLEWDRWSVMAVCELSWHNQHWFANVGSLEQWPKWAEAAEASMRNRQVSSE